MPHLESQTDPSITPYQRWNMAIQGEHRARRCKAEARTLVVQLRAATARRDWARVAVLAEQAIELAIYLQTTATLISTAQARPRYLCATVGLVVGLVVGYLTATGRG